MRHKLSASLIYRLKLLVPSKAIALIVFLLLSVTLVKATTYTWNGTTSTDWATTTNWTPNGNPGSAVGDIVSIGVVAFSGSQPTLSATPANALASITLGTATTSTLTISANYLVGSLTIGAGSTVSESGSITVTFTGDIVNNGTYTASNGLHTFATNPISLYGTLSIPNITVTTIAVMNNGSLTVGSSLAGTGTLNNASIGTLSLGGTSAITTLNNGGTTIFTGTTISSTTLTNNGTLNLQGSGAITGITNSNGGIVNLSSSGTIAAFTNGNAGILNISALTVPTFTALAVTAAGNIVNYNGAGNQTVRLGTYLNLSLSGSGLKTIPTGTIVSGKLNIAADAGGAKASLASGLNLAIRALFLGGTNQVAGTWGSSISAATNKNNTYFDNTATFTGILTVAVLSPIVASTTGPWATPGTWTGGAVPVAGDDVIINVAVTVGATVTQTGSVTINSTGSITATTANLTCGSLTINSGGSLTSSRVLTVNGSTNITGTINLSTTIRANAFNGDVILNSGAVYNETVANTLTITGSFTNNATTFTASTGVYTFSGAGMVLNGATTTSIASIAITGTYTNSGTLTVGTSLTGTGTLINNGTLNLSGVGAGSCAISSLDNNGIINRSAAGTTTTALANFSNWGTINLNGSGAITGITNNAAGIVNLASSGTIGTFTNNSSSTL